MLWLFFIYCPLLVMSKGKSIHKDITVVALSKMLVNSIDVNKSVVEECTGC